MKIPIKAVFLLLMGIPLIGTSQVGGTEETSDEGTPEQFEALFFDALQQKTIGNADRAAMLFLEAKALAPDNPVVHHELAKAYLLEDKFDAARDHALKAVILKPEEYWYLDTLMEVAIRGQQSPEILLQDLPTQNRKFSLNLARWYIHHEQPEQGMRLLNQMENNAAVLVLKSVAAQQVTTKANDASAPPQPTGVRDELANQLEALNTLLQQEDWDKAYLKAMEALEVFPLQPFFYFVAGKAQRAKGNALEALELLESGEFFLLEDDLLIREYFALMADIHLELGDEAAYKTYLNKLN